MERVKRMDDNVVMPKAFADRILDPAKVNPAGGEITPARLEEMRAAGLLIKGADPLDDIDLPEPAYGDHTLGTLTDEEAELYASFLHATQELEEINRELGSQFFHKAGDAIKNKTENEFDKADFVSDDQACRAFRLARQVECLKATFFWNLCEKYNCHDYIVGVRSKRRFVKKERKW